MDQTAAMEAETKALIEAPSGPVALAYQNLNDSRVFQGQMLTFPLFKHSASKLSELSSDHKDMTDRNQKNIEILYSAKLPQNANPRI